MAFNKGHQTWNKGLTKETNSMVAMVANNKIGKKYPNRSWNRGLTKATDTRVAKIAVSKIGHKTLPHVREILRSARIGKEPWNKGRRNCYSQETLELMGADKKGKPSAMKGKHFPPEINDENRKRAIRLWEDSEFVRKQMKARGVSPNKKELDLLTLIEPFGFKYVGDGELIIGGKCPDYWNGNEHLIELFGDYWHRGQNPAERINLFHKNGYECLVLWECEMNEPDRIILKVKEWLTGSYVYEVE